MPNFLPLVVTVPSPGKLNATLTAADVSLVNVPIYLDWPATSIISPNFKSERNVVPVPVIVVVLFVSETVPAM